MISAVEPDEPASKFQQRDNAHAGIGARVSRDQCAAMTSSDPTKNPEFQKVVRHFLTTPPKPHKPIGKKKASLKSKSGAGRKGK
jgi:hypothetical protein